MVVEANVHELSAIWNAKAIVCELCYVSSKLIEACTSVIPFLSSHLG
jgi:hypothetical protein